MALVRRSITTHTTALHTNLPSQKTTVFKLEHHKASNMTICGPCCNIMIRKLPGPIHTTLSPSEAAGGSGDGRR